jgi:UDP-N-acetylmuramate: L-alanyl-gamma-D-glutamyl-meso-diaminopimelate ligase
LLARVARELPPDERLDIDRVASDLKGRGVEAAAFANVDEIVHALTEGARPGDVIAVLSNGTFGGIHQKLLSALAERV